MLGQLADNVNISLDSINRNNLYFYYACRRNTTPTSLTAATASSYTPGTGTELYHQFMGELFTKANDPIDGKATWTLTGPSGLYACTANLNIIRYGGIVGREITVEFRENDQFVTDWHIFMPAASEYIASNIYLPLTQGNVYSVWVKCETASGDITITDTEFTAKPMVNSIPIPVW